MLTGEGSVNSSLIVLLALPVVAVVAVAAAVVCARCHFSGVQAVVSAAYCKAN